MTSLHLKNMRVGEQHNAPPDTALVISEATKESIR